MTQDPLAHRHYDRQFERKLPEGTLRVVQVTDTHLFADAAGGLLGMNTLQSLRQVLDLVRQLEGRLDCVLATGDLVHDASEAGYRRIAEELSDLGAPVYCLPGNHDESRRLKHLLTDRRVSAPSVVDLDPWRIIMLDSVIPDEEGGHLAERELELLLTGLDEAGDRHVLVCLHHQPVPVGSAWIDTMRLDNADSLFDILDRHCNVRGVLWGHVHQTFDLQRNGVPLMATPSTCVQFTPGSNDFKVDREPPGCRLLALLPDGEIASRVMRIRELPTGLEVASVGY